MDIKSMSFSSASVFPVKLLKMKILDRHGRIRPIHVQLNLTNACNFDCPFCSCGNRDKTIQLSYEYIKDVMSKAKKAGCKSVTITGGGEPLLHPQFSDILQAIKDLHISIGLVSNGTVLSKLTERDLANITWIRISCSDHLEDNLKKIGLSLDEWFNIIQQAVEKGKSVDWAFSYVLTRRPKYEILTKCIHFANLHKFTHLRLVSDLLDLGSVPCMEWVKRELSKRGVDDSLVIYQGRKDSVHGRKRCLISLLKPVIGPDGGIYPCCGVQYALYNPTKDYEKTMRMGNGRDIYKIFKNQLNFDGSNCVRCYYEQYNWALEVLTSELKHKEFV